MARTRSHTTDRRHACPHRLIWVIWVATELLAAPAWGHGELIPQDGFYLSPGLGLGLDRGSGAGGLALGGALHLTRFDNGLKWGFDAEGWYDGERAAARVLMAPSAGLGPYGIDAGYLIELPEGGGRHGVMVRLYLALVVRLHVGYAWLPDAPGFVELALQFKLPFNLKDGSIALALW